MIEIVEIIRRSEQGATKPFICRGDDGHLYFVKGAGAGARGLIAEWVAGRLGRQLGLPIPDLTLATVPHALAHHSPLPDIRDLGTGVVFASRAVPMASELRWIDVAAVPPHLQATVLLFDCWVANGDRKLSVTQGNPNLLWSAADQKLHVIDHNLAFETNSVHDIVQSHVFGGAVALWTPAFREEATARLLDVVIKCWPNTWSELPHLWVEEAAGISQKETRGILWRFAEKPAQFWPVP